MTRGALALLLGLAASLLIAWTLSATVRARVRPMVLLPADHPRVSHLLTDDRRTTFGEQAYYGFGGDAYCVYASDGADHDTLATCVYGRAGWPFRCVQGYELNDRTPASGVHGGWAIPVDRLPRFPARLVAGFIPYRPIWPGLVANTIVYAIAAWLLLRVPGDLRRRRRRRRGVCASCGYTLDTLERCPECGLTRPAFQADAIKTLEPSP